MFKVSTLVLLAAATLAAAPTNPVSELRSIALASRLTKALDAQKLDAVAAKDPDDATRFVAALYYPGAQLLVYTAQAIDPALLDTRLQYKQYRDIYVELQGRSVAGTSTFFQDMKADGLPLDDEHAADVVHSEDGKTVVLGGDWRSRGTAAAAYARQLTAADQQYSRLLTLLLAQVNPT